jgi:hypothetical protein
VEEVGIGEQVKTTVGRQTLSKNQSAAPFTSCVFLLAGVLLVKIADYSVPLLSDDHVGFLAE